jgi:sugar lactone lactonase YvrE
MTVLGTMASTTRSRLWYDVAMTFANGMALSPERDHLYVAEPFVGRVIRIPIDENGSPQEGLALP